MIDKKGKPWFIEANKWPSLYIFSETKEQTIVPLISDMIDLIMDFHENWDNMEEYIKEISEQRTIHGFDQIYNEVTGYNVLNGEYHQDPYLTK